MTLYTVAVYTTKDMHERGQSWCKLFQMS